ncbi:MAG TPA: serine/threonine-protein kinase [Coriobacteriia bacterium]|nr:serine/threonine-protein kinase [Coriobacteriia bacterium]
MEHDSRHAEQQLIVDRYRPLEELGEGAFGSVVSAWDTRMQRRVAIKRIPFPLDSHGAPSVPPGLAEARTAAMLNNPAIVTVFDFETDSDEAFLVMEYVEGASLAELLAETGEPLNLDEAAAVVDAIADALCFAHENGVLHLDIKPENVLVGLDGRVKVADFGIAELSSLAGHGAAFGGTLGYMSLEQLRGEEVSEASDEWALAAVAFEVITGDNPFADSTIEGAIRRITITGAPSVRTYDTRLPAALDDVLFAGLGVEPAERYPGVAEFADALLPHLGDARAGRASLAELVADITGDEPDAEDDLVYLGLWDRLQGSGGRVLVQLVAGAEGGWLAWAGLSAVQLPTIALWAAIALVAGGAFLAPALGLVLGLLCAVAGAIAHGAWALAAALLLIGGSWWWLFGRQSTGAAVLPLSAPVLAAARIGFLQPLIAGFTLPPLGAAIAAALGGALTMLASAASSLGAPYIAVAPSTALRIWTLGSAAERVVALASSPAAWIALLGWPVAAAVMSWLSSRATRVWAAVGALAGAGVLGGAYLLADVVARTLSQQAGYESVLTAASLAGSLILMWLACWAGAPLRPEEEDPLSVAARRREDH